MKRLRICYHVEKVWQVFLKMAAEGKKTQKMKSVRLSAFLLGGAVSCLSPAPVAAATLSCPVSLLFGNYTTCASTETATITPNNTRSTTGCLSAGGAPYNRAQCNFNQTFGTSGLKQLVISVTATKYTLNSTGTDTMVVDNFQCRFQGSTTTVTGACVRTTTPFFLLMDIGADLNITSTQAAGSYSGTFTVNTNIP